MFFPSLLLPFRSPTGESSTAAAPSTSTTFPPHYSQASPPPSRPANKVIRFHFVSPLPLLFFLSLSHFPVSVRVRAYEGGALFFGLSRAASGRIKKKGEEEK